MKRRILYVAPALALAGVLSVTGCSTAPGAAGSGVTSNTGVTLGKGGQPGKDDSIKIDEIDWTVEEGILHDTRMPVFNFTNNSKFSICGIELEFEQKEGVTEEQRAAIFADPMENSLNAEDDFSTWTLNAYQEGVVSPGEASQDVRVSIDGRGYTLNDISHMEYFEPSLMKIAYLGGDGKCYAEYYDFKTEKYKDAIEGGKEAVQWSKSSLAKKMPKLDAPLIVASSDDEDRFSFQALGVTREQFDAYVEELASNGFDAVETEQENRYAASDVKGYKVEVSFEAEKGALWGSIDASEAGEKNTASTVSAGADDEASEEMKTAMYEYETFFDEYVAFMEAYKDAGQPAEKLADYSSYLKQYAETMQAISKIDKDSLSGADLAYLLETQGRIMEKVASVA